MGESQEYWIDLMEGERRTLGTVTEYLTTLGIKMKLNNIAITANNKNVELKWELKRAGIGTESEKEGDESKLKSLIQFAFEFDMIRAVLEAVFPLMKFEIKYQEINERRQQKHAIILNKRIYRKCN